MKLLPMLGFKLNIDSKKGSPSPLDTSIWWRKYKYGAPKDALGQLGIPRLDFSPSGHQHKF